MGPAVPVDEGRPAGALSPRHLVVVGYVIVVVQPDERGHRDSGPVQRVLRLVGLDLLAQSLDHCFLKKAGERMCEISNDVLFTVYCFFFVLVG